MTANRVHPEPSRRAAEFRALANAAIDPGYRRLWESQAAYYAGEQGSGGAGENVGNSEPLPVQLPAPRPTPKWRAANEGAWARLFDALGVAWKYEALEPELSRALMYVPDFWLCDRLAWLEVKSVTPTPGEFRAARELLAATGERVYMVAGWPRRRGYGLWVFSKVGEAMAVRNDISDLALCNLLDCSFSQLYAAFDEVKR
jgi:hypothetical protein